MGGHHLLTFFFFNLCFTFSNEESQKLFFIPPHSPILRSLSLSFFLMFLPRPHLQLSENDDHQ